MEPSDSKDLIRHFHKLFVVFILVIIAVGLIAYLYAASLLKKQLVLKCEALAATVSAVIAEDSDGYAAFLGDMDMESAYYQRMKALMMNLKRLNVEHVTYIYTTARADADTIMYVLGGEPPESPVYTAPGVRDAITPAERAAYGERKSVLGDAFEETTYGRRLSAYHPIIHKETGAFLGLVGADITQTQFNRVMGVFIFQITASLLAGLAVMALATRRLSGSAYLVVNRQLFAAHEAEQRLEIENAALDKVNKMRSDIIATISHESRTPLAVLASYVGLVSMELKAKGILGQDEQITADLDAVAFEARRVANLIDGMRKLSQQNEVKAERAVLDIGEIIRQTTRLYGPIIERGDVRLETDIACESGGSFPAYNIFGNAEELTQVIFNLLQNAKNHTERGVITASVRREGENVAVTISDTGTGVGPELLPRVFERGAAGEGGGTGIGLAICRDVVASHGGAITMSSEPGVGTAVTFTLPVYRDEPRDGDKNAE